MSIKGFSIGGVTQKYDYNALDNIPEVEGLSEEAKQALLQLAQKVAYIDDQGQTYYDNLYDAFYPPKTVVLITAVFEQGSTVIYDDTALDELKQHLTVTAKYDDNTTAILADSAYSLSGLLEAPSSTVTVLYNGVSTTFTVAVTARSLSSISAVYTQSGTVYDTDTLDSLKADLVVTAHYSDSSTQTVAAADYTLSGTLTAGTSTIMVSYGGKTDSFNVVVTQTLPNDYTRLSYVEANGNQYINTGIAETDAERAVYEVMVTSRPATNGNHILSSKNVYFPFLRGGSESSFPYQIGANNHGTDSVGDYHFSWELNKKYKLEGFPDVFVDNSYQFTLARGTAGSATNKLYIFAYGGAPTNATYRFHGRLYSMKVFDSNDNIIGFFIPCRNPSNTIGLYDVVTASFLTSSGLTGGTE